tara:strand:- start:5170 stop:5982 length:813 start_codon:yes stop_codon:yes gene_type:complete
MLPQEKSMKIAIIVPAFKAAKYIKAALSSIDKQNKPKGTEIKTIVICDGCEETFEAATLCRSADTYVCLTENLGTYKARNLGLSLSGIESDLFINLDADDIWHPNRIAEVVGMARHRLDSLSAFTCFMNRIDEEGKEIRSLPHRECPSGAYAYTGKTVKTIGMYRPWWCGSDNEYRGRFYAAGGNLYSSTRLLLSYRKHPTQLTSHPDTLRGTKERDFSYDEIARLSKTNYETHFQNHPRQEIFKSAGTALHYEETYQAYFDSQPLTVGD